MSSVLGNKHNAFHRVGVWRYSYRSRSNHLSVIILTCYSFQHRHIYYIAHMVQVEQGKGKLTKVDQITKLAQL